jgi:hypothetical protein
MVAVCPASMLPAVAAPAQSLDKAIPAPAILLTQTYHYTLAKAAVAPPERPPAYSSPSAVCIRFCTFQK